nr:hypothetical protein [Bacilli bacterium]
MIDHETNNRKIARKMMKIGMVMIIIGDLLSIIGIIIQIKRDHSVSIETLIVALVQVVLTLYFIRIAKNMGYIFNGEREKKKDRE